MKKIILILKTLVLIQITNFLSDRLDINKDKKNYLLEGSLRNKKSVLNDQILQVTRKEVHLRVTRLLYHLVSSVLKKIPKL